MGQGTVVTASHADSLRIVRANGLAVQIPAACVLAIDKLLRHALETDQGLEVQPVGEASEQEETGWEASFWNSSGVIGFSYISPWGAVVDLAGRLGSEQ